MAYQLHAAVKAAPFSSALSFELSSSEPVLLSTLIGESLVARLAGQELCQLTFTLPEAAEVSLTDDLEKLNCARVEITVELSAKSSLQYRLLVTDESASAQQLEKRLNLIFLGERASANVECRYHLSSKVYKLATVQDHRAPATNSSLVVKGVFEGDAFFKCDNLVRIAPGANQVEAAQVNKNLLLSPQSRAVSIPKMEVLAHEVSCKHGAATSRIDDEQLFYLQSRGLPLNEARALLIEAFLR